MVKFTQALYAAYVGCDAAMFEINPVLKTSDDKIIAVDSKVSLDGNALYRHPDYAAMRDKTEEDPTEVEADEAGLNYVKLDGNVGCMVNGAGLAMATMDIIKLSGESLPTSWTWAAPPTRPVWRRPSASSSKIRL